MVKFDFFNININIFFGSLTTFHICGWYYLIKKNIILHQSNIQLLTKYYTVHNTDINITDRV